MSTKHQASTKVKTKRFGPTLRVRMVTESMERLQTVAAATNGNFTPSDIARMATDEGLPAIAARLKVSFEKAA